MCGKNIKTLLEIRYMGKEFLYKAVNQIVSETIVDIDDDKVTYPVKLSIQVFYDPPFASYGISHEFIRHCEEVYGLNPDEIKYVWREYKSTLKRLGKL